MHVLSRSLVINKEDFICYDKEQTWTKLVQKEENGNYFTNKQITLDNLEIIHFAEQLKLSKDFI